MFYILYFVFSGAPARYDNQPTFISPRIKLAAPLRPLRPLQPPGRHHLHQVHHSLLGPAGLQQPPDLGILRLLPTGGI